MNENVIQRLKEGVCYIEKTFSDGESLTMRATSNPNITKAFGIENGIVEVDLKIQLKPEALDEFVIVEKPSETNSCYTYLRKTIIDMYYRKY